MIKKLFSIIPNNKKGNITLLTIMVLTVASILIHTSFKISHTQNQLNNSFEKDLQLNYLVESAYEHAMYVLEDEEIEDDFHNIVISENKNYEFEIIETESKVDIKVEFKDFQREIVSEY